jgi:WD40 repeat protein
MSDYDERSHVIVALGTNAKNVHTLSYSTCYENENTPISPKKEIDFLDVHRGSVYSMDYLSQEKIIATGSNDKAVKLCNMASGTIGPPLKGHSGTIRIVKFNALTSALPILASGGAGDNCPRIWDINKCSCISALEPHEDAVHALTWLDNDILLSGCDKGKIVAHDIRSRSAAWTLELPRLVGQSLGICTMSVTRPGSNSVILGCTGGLVLGISTRDRRLLVTEKLHGDDVRGLCIAPWQDSNVAGNSSTFYFLTTSFDCTACVWRSQVDFNNQNRFQRLSVLNAHSDKVLGAAIGPDNYEMITTGADGKAILWKPKISSTFL